MVALDIFHSDPFSTITLTTAVERTPYVPDGIEAMGIFEDDPIRTEILMVEQRQGQLVIVPFTDRGSPGTQRNTEQRQVRGFKVPRLRMEETIYSRELATIRAFGTETELMQVEAEVARRTVGPTGLRQNLRYTQEFHRLAALQGLLLDSDGSVKYNWFTEFGITANGVVPFNLAAGTAGTIRPAAAQIVRSMARKAQGAFLNSTRVTALCGDDFFDKLVTHPDVVQTYANWQAAVALRQGTAFEAFSYAGVDWVNYRGSDDNISISAALTNGSAVATVGVGNTGALVVGNNVSGPNIAAGTTIASINAGAGTFTMSGNYGGATANYILNIGGGVSTFGGGAISVPSNKAIFFPKGAPGIFKRALAPADGFEWVNTLGRPEYVRMIFDRDRNEWVKIEMSVYPLHICTRPEVLFTGTMDAAAD